MITKEPQPPADINSSFIYPQYKNNCISNIPSTILHLLNTQTKPNPPLQNHIKEADCKNTNKVVLLVVDGFGFSQFLEHHKQNPFLASLAGKGDVSPITSVYPSQTTNAFTTLNTGLTPQEHGVFEYFIYLKEVGVVNALRFERIGSTRRKRLTEEGFSPRLMFRGKSIHQTLKEKGIPTFTHMHTSNASNACSQLIFEGSTIVPSQKTSDLIVNLRKNLEEADGGYFFVHIDSLDTISHQYGPQSSQFTAELSAITYLLQKELVEKIDSATAKETLLLMTADHGAIDTNPDQTIYLNRTQKPLTYRQCGKDRKRILPTGSPRDIFLHIKEEKLEETKEALTQQIGAKAQILETSEAIRNGLFGVGEASREFVERAGNLLILPYDKETVWFSNPEGRKITFLGQHGGLNSQEMFVPFAAVNLGYLKK
jgi:predicted AlkP superfamily pyrophosphatase or phosphodiesterase